MRWVACAAAVLLAACGASDQPDNGAFVDAYNAHRAQEVTVTASVVTVLPDSSSGADGPHQRFDVDVSGVVVEIDHNLDLAARVPVQVGNQLTIHGQFEPDPGHPVIHYTHHATGSHEGGWIDLAGQRYD
jgi:uncharacterized protein DUF3465